MLGDLLLLVGLAIPIVALAHRVNAPPLVGFLIAGVVVGPSGLGLIAESASIEALSELSVALLLFAVGLELSLTHVRTWARSVFVGGGVQVGGTTAFITLVAVAFGIPLAHAIFYATLAAMSSTAIVTKAYADRAELDTPHGRTVIAILLFQDLCIFPLMLLLPLLGELDGDAALGALGAFATGLTMMTALVVGGRVLVRWTLDRVVLFKDRELFTLCVGFFGIGAALVTSWAGFSLAIGAFIAGLVISESEYGLQALSDVLPFRSLFSGIFFASIGMLLDVSAILERPLFLVALMLFLLLTKIAWAAAGVMAARGRFPTALMSGLSLAQIGEFSFLLAAVGVPLGLFRESDYQVFLSTAVVSMMAAPFLIHAARPIVDRIEGWLGHGVPSKPPPLSDDVSDHSIIIGYGLAGRYLARVLRAAGISCVVVDQNPELVSRARDDGMPVVFGDGTRHAVLEHVQVQRARAIIFAIASPADERRGVVVAREMNPTVRIVVRTRYVRAIDDLMALGASDVVVEEFEASLELFAKALEGYEIPINRIWQELESVRSEHYGLFRGKADPDLRLDTLKHLGIHDALELVEVEADSGAVGETASTLGIRHRTGAVQIAVVRDGRPIYERQRDFRYRSGDTVVLVGDRRSLADAMTLFRAQGPTSTAGSAG